MVAATVLAACGSDGSGQGFQAESSSSSVPTGQSGPPSESVPASVQKDSVLDLNSTKDMTGVVTTVTFGDSPYAAHFPDICESIPNSALREMGYVSKKKSFTGTQLVTQGCNFMTSAPPYGPLYKASVAMYVNNLKELLDQEGNQILEQNVPISPKVTATVYRNLDTDVGVVPGQEICKAAWGTFFGGIIVFFYTNGGYVADDCARVIDTARRIAPYMPKSPSQMRPAP